MSSDSTRVIEFDRRIRDLEIRTGKLPTRMDRFSGGGNGSILYTADVVANLPALTSDKDGVLGYTTSDDTCYRLIDAAWVMMAPVYTTLASGAPNGSLALVSNVGYMKAGGNWLSSTHMV